MGILPMGWPWEDYSKKGGVSLDHLNIKDNSKVRKINTAKSWPPEEWPKRLKALCESYSDMLINELKSNKWLKVPDTVLLH